MDGNRVMRWTSTSRLVFWGALPLSVACGSVACGSVAGGESDDAKVAEPARRQQALASDPTFTDVTDTAEIAGGEAAWAAAWADFDDDEDLDFFSVANSSDNLLWVNDGDGTFTEGTADAGIVTTKLNAHSVQWGDFDRDGDPDLVIVREGGGASSSYAHELWRNDAGTFTEIGAQAGILGVDHIARGSAVVDFDRDGWLDLMLVIWEAPDPGGTDPIEIKQNLLFRNNGDMTFTDVGEDAGIAFPTGLKRSVAWGDYDNDDWPDLIINPPCELFHNNGDGTFTDATVAAGITTSDQCQAAAFADYDNDGDLDLYTSRGFDAKTPDVLYSNDGDGTFTNATAAAGISDAASSRSASWGDYDNDGDEDLYVVSLTNATYPNYLYRNKGDGTFENVADSAGAEGQVPGSGIDGSFVDYDTDGDLDLFITNGEGTADGEHLLLQSSGNENHWLKLKLVGTDSNPDALMARVSVETGLGAHHYVYTGQNHFLTQNLVPLHVGLGSEDAVQSVTVDWPSGLEETFDSVSADALNVLVEGSTGVGGAGGAGGAAGSAGAPSSTGGVPSNTGGVPNAGAGGAPDSSGGAPGSGGAPNSSGGSNAGGASDGSGGADTGGGGSGTAGALNATGGVEGTGATGGVDDGIGGTPSGPNGSGGEGAQASGAAPSEAGSGNQAQGGGDGVTPGSGGEASAQGGSDGGASSDEDPYGNLGFNDSSCGCSIPGHSSSNQALGMLGVAALSLIRRRKSGRTSR
jgi:enediyne biosynthesis protein E4